MVWWDGVVVGALVSGELATHVLHYDVRTVACGGSSGRAGWMV